MQTRERERERVRDRERDELGGRREKTDARRQQQNATMRVNGERDKQASEREREWS